MPSHAARVLCIGTAAFQIALIAVKRLADRNRAVRVIGAGLTARHCPRHIDRLPVGKDMPAVGGFKIVGQPDALDPIGAVAVGTAYAPGARPGVAPVARPMPGLIVVQTGFFRTSRRRRAVAVSSLAARGFGIWRGL